MATTALERLRRLLSLFSREDRLLIIINADPDAMASAMALKRLLWRQVSATCIAHVNTISRPDNLAMIRHLKLDLLPFEKVSPEQFTRFAIVDSQPSHHEGLEGIGFDVIIDHHPASGDEATFVDIRPEYGAVSTIMTQYLRAAKIKPSVKLATGLFYGIKTDTSNFERKSVMEDVNAFQFLFRYVNVHMARSIEQAELTLDSLKYYRRALEAMRVQKRRVHVHLGPVSNPDVCVSIADFFMKIHDIAWTVVSGTYQGRLVIIVRNDEIRKDAGRLLSNVFGHLGTAGGHKGMARTEIPLENLKGVVQYKDDKVISRWIARQLDRHT
ncbi:MAG: DHH family phosphoesterase [Deltaproteobacteria bacterium]|nr:DHH family phosphoesterase [Deltaproteobacteria bacterium]